MAPRRGAEPESAVWSASGWRKRNFQIGDRPIEVVGANTGHKPVATRPALNL